MKNTIQKLIGLTGFELRKKHGSRNSVAGVFKQLHSKGFAPTIVIDAGAAYGDWTREAHPYFPAASYHLFEPLEEYAPSLSAVGKEIPNTHIHYSLLGNESMEQTINVHADLVGSSVHSEVESEEQLGATRRSIVCKRLDDVFPNLSDQEKVFLKVDTQGTELAVLAGASNLLSHTDVIQLEISLFKSIQGAPLFDEVVTHLAAKGFVLYDLTNFTYRPLDNALAQVDGIFVRSESAFRENHAFATPGQRKAQNERFIRTARERLQK